MQNATGAQKAVLVLILVGVEGRIKEGVWERLGPEDCRIEQGYGSRRNSKSIKTQMIWHVLAT